MGTPSKSMSRRDQRVTQWMSVWKRLARHGLELGPIELERVVDLAPDLEVPRLEIDSRHGAVVQHRPLLGEVLAGWDALLLLLADARPADQKAAHQRSLRTWGELGRRVSRHRVVKRLTLVALLVAFLLGCASPPAPTATPVPNLATLPVPAGISGIPRPGTPSATLIAHTPAGTIEIGVEQTLALGHCGLGSPIDFDGSLWDPTFADNGSGGPLTDDQIGELINQTAVVLVLVDGLTAQIVTPRGARILLKRHDRARPYGLCL